MNLRVQVLKSFSLACVMAALTTAPNGIGQTILNSWPGISRTHGSSPPDSHGAAGPKGILAIVNVDIEYFTKGGTSVWGGPVDLATFWAGVGNTGDFDPGSGNAINGDPKAIYDPSSGRFYVIMQENTATASFLNLAVSKTSHPTGSGTNDWFFYRMEITETVGGIRYWADYPGLGVDGQAVYVTFNMLAVGYNAFFNSQIIALNKTDITRGNLTFKQAFTVSPSGGTLVPASVFGPGSPGNRAYFVEVSFPTAVSLWVLADPLGSALLLPPLAIPVAPNGDFPGPGAPQADTPTRLDTLGEELKAQGNAFWRDGSIWFCYTGGVLFDQRTRVYYYRIDTDPIPNVGDSGDIDGGDGVWTFQPAIGGNSCGDLCLVYCESSASEYPRIMCATRPRGASSFEAPFAIKNSPSFYTEGKAEARWGDYASVSADPMAGTFWITHEWARSSNPSDWGTWWAQIAVTPPPVHNIYVNNTADPVFGHCCPIQDGSRDCGPFAGPYCAVAVAMNQALCGDILNIKAGSYNEHFPISKPLRLQSYDGPATIGR